MSQEQYIPGVQEDRETQDLISRLEKYANERASEVEQQTAEEYFNLLLQKGLEARKQGNYGIAAALVLRSNNKETIVIGKNAVFSEEDPHGHAEMNAIKNAIRAKQSSDVKQQLINSGDLIERDSLIEGDEILLVTTLEPCPMCTVGSVINAKIDRLLIGSEDEFAGSIEKSRLESLPPLWAIMAENQGLKIDFAQSTDPEQKDTFVNEAVKNSLNDLFFQTKERLDKKLEDEGFVDLLSLVQS